MNQHLGLARSWKLACSVAALAALAATPIARGEGGPTSSRESVYPSEYPSVADMGEPAELPELDESSTLQDYLVYAEMNNPGLRAAYERWQAALERVPQVTSLPDPRLSYGYFIREVETRVGPQRQKFGLSQSFPWFGTLSLQGNMAAEAANAEKSRFDAARLELAYRVENAYYEYYYFGRAVRVTRDIVDLVSSLEKVLETMFRAGETSNANLIKAQVELGTLQDRLRSLEDVRAPVVARLNAALNRPPDTPVPEPEEIPFDEVEVSSEELASKLAESNPELHAIDSMAEKEKTSISLARKAYYPDFTLGVDYVDTSEARMAGVEDSGTDAIMAMAAINIPLWHGKYRAAEKEARARYEAALEERADRENTLTADLEMALYEFRDAERKIALYRDTLIPRAEQSLEVTREAFTAGQSDFLNIIDAERILLEFRLSYERALANRSQRLARIDMLVGADLSAPGAPEQKTGEEEENK